MSYVRVRLREIRRFVGVHLLVYQMHFNHFAIVGHHGCSSPASPSLPVACFALIIFLPLPLCQISFTVDAGSKQWLCLFLVWSRNTITCFWVSIALIYVQIQKSFGQQRWRFSVCFSLFLALETVILLLHGIPIRPHQALKTTSTKPPSFYRPPKYAKTPPYELS